MCVLWLSTEVAACPPDVATESGNTNICFSSLYHICILLGHLSSFYVQTLEVEGVTSNHTYSSCGPVRTVARFKMFPVVVKIRKVYSLEYSV